MSRKKASIPKVPVPKTQYITKEYSLSVRDTLIACMPSLLGIFLCLGVTVIGWRAIMSSITNLEMQSFALIMFLIILLPKLLDMVPTPTLTWRVETKEEQ